MKLYINVISFKCGKKFYKIFKKFTDDEGIKVGLSISDGDDGEWQKSVPKVFSDLSSKSDSKSNFITWKYSTALEYTSVDQKICFQFTHRGKIIYQFYILVSAFTYGEDTAFRTIGTHDEKGELTITTRFSN